MSNFTFLVLCAVVGVALSQRLWPNGNVPYVSTIKAVNAINEALQAIEANTKCITFTQKTAADKYFIEFKHGGGCYSYVGMMTRTNPIYLSPPCYRSKDIVMHEVGHALGLNQHPGQKPSSAPLGKADFEKLNKMYTC
ncbi:zinc metalloproteinase nas-13-like [Hydractinia symbiolongicarpus]|uniref:zinc metalloproteinase nas-13-like n=1 Tax=Hydractinia symbiolongicarpus TaxID=13093 RepID=UPI002549FCA9|nr:zinc metalloproteinase nas-13-like [Hydractinia symbiolongicarpus]